MPLKTYLNLLAPLFLLGVAVVAATVHHPHHHDTSLELGKRQQQEDSADLYLCSNPDFNHDCDGCACERLTEIVTAGGYEGPPCYPLPDDLRVGPPQGVSSARSYSKWNCTLYDNASCNSTRPGSTLNIPSGPPGLMSLGAFDDRAVTYRCYALP